MIEKKKEMSETQIQLQKKLIEKHLKEIGLRKQDGRFISVRYEQNKAKMDFLRDNHPELLDPCHLP